jgi:putative DNA primase/helicase
MSTVHDEQRERKSETRTESTFGAARKNGKPHENGGPGADRAEVNFLDAEHYLETLDPHWQQTIWVFQTYDDDKTRNDETLGQTLIGTWAQCRDKLAELNARGASICVTVNHCDGGRKKDNVRAVRAVWHEDDGLGPVPAFPLSPQIRVESSPGKFHTYWTTDDMTIPEHARLMRVMVDKYGSDERAAHLNCVLRLPGFYHRKVDPAKGLTGQPWRVTLVAESRDALPPYRAADLLRAFGVEEWERTHPCTTQDEAHAAPLSPEEQERILAELPEYLPDIPADTYPRWFYVGAALHYVDRGERGFTLFHTWSQSCPEKYRGEDDCLRQWRRFKQSGNATGTRTHKSIYDLAIRYRARRAGAADAAQSDPGDFADDARDDPLRTGAGECGYRLTDTGLAERFARRHGRRVRWVEPWKKWLVYDTSHWARDDVQRVRQFAKQTVQALYHEAGEDADPRERKKVAVFAIRSEARKSREAMIELAKSEHGIPALPDLFDTDPWLLNVANGTLDLRTGTLREHSAADYITKYIPIAYDPQADCPLWEDFLTAVMAGNDDVIDFLWKAIGYSLTGDVREDALFFCYGAGANGKSTFLNVLRALLADYGKQAAFETFLQKKHEGISNDVADLAGCRLVVASEAEEGRRFSMSKVKSFTGKDKIKARFLHQENFEFPPQMKIWLAANHKPEIRSTDHATWRRWRLIPFTRCFKEAGHVKEKKDAEQVKDMLDKLLTELPGILAWAVRGCLAWQQDGLPLPETVRVATEAYRNESDIVGAFLSECCVMDPTGNVLIASLYDRYVEWCKKSGEDAKTKKAFGILMYERGFESGKDTAGLRVWIGVKLDI